MKPISWDLTSWKPGASWSMIAYTSTTNATSGTTCLGRWDKWQVRALTNFRLIADVRRVCWFLYLGAFHCLDDRIWSGGWIIRIWTFLGSKQQNAVKVNAHKSGQIFVILMIVMIKSEEKKLDLAVFRWQFPNAHFSIFSHFDDGSTRFYCRSAASSRNGRPGFVFY